MPVPMSGRRRGRRIPRADKQVWTTPSASPARRATPMNSTSASPVSASPVDVAKSVGAEDEAEQHSHSRAFKRRRQQSRRVERAHVHRRRAQGSVQPAAARRDAECS